MFGMIDVLSMDHNKQLYIAGSDATRVTAMIEAMTTSKARTYLVGPCFAPSPLDHPTREQLPSPPGTMTELKKYVDQQHEADNIAVNVNLTALNCPTDPTKPATVISAYPAARSGYTATHQVLEWATWRYFAAHYLDGTLRSLALVFFLFLSFPF